MTQKIVNEPSIDDYAIGGNIDTFGEPSSANDRFSDEQKEGLTKLVLDGLLFNQYDGASQAQAYIKQENLNALRGFLESRGLYNGEIRDYLDTMEKGSQQEQSLYSQGNDDSRSAYFEKFLMEQPPKPTTTKTPLTRFEKLVLDTLDQVELI